MERLGVKDTRLLSQCGEVARHVGVSAPWKLVLLTGWLYPEEFRPAAERAVAMVNYVGNGNQTIFHCGEVDRSARCDRLYRWYACTTSSTWDELARDVFTVLKQKRNSYPEGSRPEGGNQTWKVGVTMPPPPEEIHATLAKLRALFAGDEGWEDDPNKIRGWENG